MDIKEITGMKLEPGMMLVYTPAKVRSESEAGHDYKIFREAVANALQVDVHSTLPVSIIMASPGDKLELLRCEDKRCDKCEFWANPMGKDGQHRCGGMLGEKCSEMGAGGDFLPCTDPDFYCGHFKVKA